MKHKHYNIILFAGFVAVVSFLIIFRSITTSLEDQFKTQVQKRPSSESLSEQSAKSAEPQAVKSRSLAVSDPGDYHIVPRKSELPKTQRYWNSRTRQILRDSDVIDRMAQGNAFKGVQKTPEQFKKQLKQIDGRISEYKLKLQNNPSDEYARQKLQNLYMLKSTVSSLREVVVRDSKK